MKQNKVCTNLAQDFTDAEKAQGRSNIGAVSASEVSTAISNAVGQLDVSDNVTANQFVTSVSESDGRVSVTRRQPVIADVSGLQDALSRITPQVQSDWTETDENLPSFVKHKPENLVQDANYVHTDNNFTSTLKNKLAGIEAGAEVNIQSDWSTTDQSADSFIRNKPNLAAVATSGSYNDLSDKPNLATVATSGSYNDLTNKPNLATVATTGSYTDLTDKPNLATVATTGSYTDLTNKPNLAAVATSGSYNDLTNKPTIPAAQVNSDWDATTGVAAISNKPTFENVADSTTTFDANTPIVVGYNSTSKKLITRLVSALMSFLGISVSGNAKSFSGTANTADNVNSDTITYAPNGAYVPVIYNNDTRLKVVAGANGLILQKAADSDISLLNCKSALAADADHAANSDTVSNHTVGTDVPADAKFIEYVTAANTFDEIKAIVNAGHEPVLKVESSSGGVSHKLRLPLVYFETGTMSAQVARFSGTHGDKIYTYTLMAGSWSTETKTVPAALSAGNGVDITSNTVSAKVKSSGGINVDSNGLYVDGHYVSYDANQGLGSTSQRNARKNINALTWNQFTDFSNTLTLGSTGRTFLDNNVVWAGNSPRHTWKGMWSIVVPAHCYMLWSIGGQLRVQENAQTEWAISLNEDSNTYPTSELYSTYFMSNGSGILSTNLPGIWHFYSSGLNQHTVYIGMYNSSADTPSTGASVYGKIYAPAGDGQRKIGPWLTYFIMEAANIKADE